MAIIPPGGSVTLSYGVLTAVVMTVILLVIIMVIVFFLIGFVSGRFSKKSTAPTEVDESKVDTQDLEMMENVAYGPLQVANVR